VIVIRFEGGVWAERTAARPGQVLRAPEHLDAEEAAAFGISFATAWYAQAELARARSGESALIQAAAGATGSAAVQLAKASGLGPVIGTAGSPEKCALLERLGVDRAVCYREEDFRGAVREATEGSGVHYCLESVGGDVFSGSLEALHEMGRMVLIGFTSVDKDYSNAVPRIHPLHLFHRSLGIFGLNVENIDFPSRTETWNRLVELSEREQLRPHVGQRFPLAEVGRAQAAIEARETVGKVVCLP
jgi:NADPH2:quinone reductase